jgi:hypothetical protein
VVEVLVGDQHGGRLGDQLGHVRRERPRVDQDGAAVPLQFDAGVGVLGYQH